MYKHTTTPFGDYTKHTFFNERSGNGFSLVPEVGGTLLDIWLDQRPIISGCRTPEELEDNQAFKSSLLFPFPNRLADGQYEHNGEVHQFPINNPETNNALHGLSRDVPMDVLSKETSAAKAHIKLSYFDEGSNDAYPFAFLVDVEYHISDATGFELKLRFTNEANTSIPVGLGWHPYFQLGPSIDVLQLQLPDSEMIEIDARMLPTGQRLPYTYFAQPRTINKAVLDNGFLLRDTSNRQIVQLSHDDFSLAYWQETGPRKFNYLQVYTPPSRDTIAIEPMTCNIDAFNNGNGLVLLQPEDFLEVRCGVKQESQEG